VEETELEKQERERVAQRDSRFQGWRSQEVTQEMFKLLRAWRQALMEQWAVGVFQGETVEATALANASAIGEINLLTKLIEIDAEQIEEALNGE
jgi:hypothetical protein